MPRRWKRIILAVMVIVVLAAAWSLGGGRAAVAPTAAANTPNQTVTITAAETPATPTSTPAPTPTSTPAASPAPTPAPTVAPGATSAPDSPPTPTAAPTAAPKPSPAPTPAPTPSPAPTPADSGTFAVTLTVRCDTLLNNMDLLDPAKQELVPADGIIFSSKTVTANSGDSVFDVLQREMKRAKIQMDFSKTPGDGSAYIKGIDNLYEFDAGALSGWLYKVNGQFPGYSCSLYPLKAGDAIVFVYSCDLGQDVGDPSAGG